MKKGAALAAIVLVLAFVVTGCPNPSGPGLDTVATPTFSPAAGTYDADQSVTIACATSGATIYYTTNGSTPSTSSTQSTGAISVSGSGTTTIKAIAAKSGMTTSAVASAAFTISYLTTVATPVLSPTAHDNYEDVSVDITDATPGASIYYTTNGTAPSTSSTPYTTTIHLTGDNTTTWVRAIAVKAGMNPSAEASSTYWIKYVYTAGYQATSGNQYPYFWKGSVATYLQNGTGFYGGMDSISVNSANGWVYAAGYQRVPVQTYNYGVSWVDNGSTSSPTLMTQDTYDAEAQSVWYDSSYMYTAGWYGTSSRKIACYWRDGSTFGLAGDGSHDAQAFSITVSSGTFYVAGYFSDGSKDTPCYWTGASGTSGSKIDLVGDGTGLHSARAFSIVVDSTNFYAAGYYSDGSKKIPCFWYGSKGTAGNKVDLPGGLYDAVAQSVCRSAGGTTYTAGYFDDGSKQVPCYWEGVTGHPLAGDGTHDAQATGIVYNTYGSHAFISGWYGTGTATVACFWDAVTGTGISRHELTATTSGAEAKASSICIMP
jgi:hypothetical protein